MSRAIHLGYADPSVAFLWAPLVMVPVVVLVNGLPWAGPFPRSRDSTTDST